jgi:hypothetical protein
MKYFHIEASSVIGLLSINDLIPIIWTNVK